MPTSRHIERDRRRGIVRCASTGPAIRACRIGAWDGSGGSTNTRMAVATFTKVLVELGFGRVRRAGSGLRAPHFPSRRAPPDEGRDLCPELRPTGDITPPHTKRDLHTKGDLPCQRTACPVHPRDTAAVRRSCAGSPRLLWSASPRCSWSTTWTPPGRDRLPRTLRCRW